MIRPLTLDEVLKHSSSRANLRLVRGDGDTVFPGLAFFARRATRGSFYVVQDPQLEGKAAKTEDELLAAAIDAGFTRFVVPEAMAEFAAPAEATVISADDPMAGAIAMVRSVEDHARGKIVTVAGSVGKTTVKEMTRQAIEYIHPLAEVEPSALNPNMFRPVLRNISRAGRYDFSVIEVSAAAILRGLEHDFLVSSDVTIITSISEAHLDAFGTVERAAKTKARILDRPRTPESVAVVYGDSRFSDDLAERARDMGWSRTISYGSAAGNDVQLVGAEVSTGAVSARVYGEPIDFRMESVRGGGKHWAVNAMASIAALVALGEDWQKAIPALESFSPPAGRGNKWRVPAPVGGEATVVNAAFNASHSSVVASIAAVSSVARQGDGRKILVLGDMGELGSSAQRMHESLVDLLNEADIDVLYMVGPLMRAIASSITSVPDVRAREPEELLPEVGEDLRNGDFVYVKGGNAQRLIPLLLEPLHKRRILQ